MNGDSPNGKDFLDDTVCIIAGAGDGLGKHAAVHLADRDARLVINDLGTSVRGEGADSAVIEDVAREIRDRGGEVVTHHGDASSPETAAALVETAHAEYGRIDALVNFVGILRDGWLTNLTDDDWDTLMRANLRSNFVLLREAASHWRSVAQEQLDRPRFFVGVSSRGALGNPGQVNYSASKAGVLGFVRSASSELYESGVRVNALIPSGFTRMTESVPPEHRPYTREEMPPERVAPMVAYLVSDAARDVTGCTFYAGGDRIGLFSDPRMERSSIRKGGWTAEAIAAEMDGPLAEGVELTRTERFL